jgi:alkanesulfonate monooxygenase SsuD/methylene tetrahydromethanopterin reductase-like flavin-dependent oxidoreductase (luciferase family)
MTTAADGSAPVVAAGERHSGPLDDGVRVGLTLPQFQRDPEVVVAVARAADAAGVDGVFAYDHVFRLGRDGARRPALEMSAVLGLVAAETTRVGIGTLVARATLRPAATLVSILDAAHRLSGGRLVAGIGSGDAESRPEHEAYGIPFPPLVERVARLEEAVLAARDRGYPVWIGGQHPRVLDVAGRVADGWNRWGADAADFAGELVQVQAAAAAAGRPAPVATWGGIVLLAPTDAAADARAEALDAGPHVVVGSPARVAERLRDRVEAGARWLVLAPLDASDPAGAELAVAVRDALG